MLNRSDRLRLIFATRSGLNNLAAEDQLMTLGVFGIRYDEQVPGTFESMISDALVGAEEEDLVTLALHLEVDLPPALTETPSASDTPAPVDPYKVDAYTELVAAETALRQMIRLVLQDKWQQHFSVEDIAKLETKQQEEERRRDGVTVSSDLLDYTETYHLKMLIEKHWAEFKQVLDDKARTLVYLSIILDIRNTIAHSRPVVPSERLLIAGAAGQLQNQLARYRSAADGPEAHYASINYIRDSSGYELKPVLSQPVARRLTVGEQLRFECSASDPRNRQIEWEFLMGSAPWGVFSVVPGQEQLVEKKVGNVVTFEWTVSREDVGEYRSCCFRIRNSSPYQRSDWGDDARSVNYSVNPPFD